MFSSDVLERASEPYASPMYTVPKHGGKDIRIVCDFRALNQSIVKDTCQIPRILQVQNKMKDAKHFSMLDLKSWFHQIPSSRRKDRKQLSVRFGVVFITLAAALDYLTVLKVCNA